MDTTTVTRKVQFVEAPAAWPPCPHCGQDLSPEAQQTPAPGKGEWVHITQPGQHFGQLARVAAVSRRIVRVRFNASDGLWSLCAHMVEAI